MFKLFEHRTILYNYLLNMSNTLLITKTYKIYLLIMKKAYIFAHSTNNSL